MLFIKHIHFIKQVFLKSLFFVMLSMSALHGQQDAQYTQYMYNTVSVNPAYAGSRGHLSAAALHR